MDILIRRAAPNRRRGNVRTLWSPDGRRHVGECGRASLAARRGIGTEALLVAVDLADRMVRQENVTCSKSAVVRERTETRSLLSIDTPYASLSPDGQWVAFHTYEKGRPIPYVQSLSDPGARFQIAHEGHAPLWSPDGRKLFYVSGETNSLMAIDVQTTPAVAFGQAVVLAPEIAHGLRLSGRWYDVTPDGRHLLVQVPDWTDPRLREIHVVLNWTEELKQRVAAR